MVPFPGFDSGLYASLHQLAIGFLNVVMIGRTAQLQGAENLVVAGACIGTDHHTHGTKFSLDHLQTLSQGIIGMINIQFIDLPVQQDHFA